MSGQNVGRLVADDLFLHGPADPLGLRGVAQHGRCSPAPAGLGVAGGALGRPPAAGPGTAPALGAAEPRARAPQGPRPGLDVRQIGRRRPIVEAWRATRSPSAGPGAAAPGHELAGAAPRAALGPVALAACCSEAPLRVALRAGALADIAARGYAFADSAKTQLVSRASRYPEREKPSDLRRETSIQSSPRRGRSRALRASRAPTPGTPWVALDGRGRRIPYCRRTKRVYTSECVMACGASAEHGHEFSSWVPCKQLDCIQCREIVARRRASKLWERFGGRGLSAFVFTFPREWHEDIDADRVKGLRTRIVRLLDQWSAEEHGVKRGWLAAFHPEGDERPGVWQPHFHMLSPLVGVPVDDPEALHELHKARADESFTGFIPAIELESLKSAWESELKLIADELGRNPAEVRSNLHYSFASPGDEPKARHLLRYTARPFPAWSAKDSTLPKSRLLIGEFSLCSPRAKGGRLWRDFVRGLLVFGPEEPSYNAHELLTQGRICPCCSGPLRAVCVVGVEDRRAPWVPAHDPDSGWWDGPPKPAAAAESWMLTDDEIERYALIFEGSALNRLAAK